jgi:uncharacterized short protein YbdD (DUF466 family)
MLNFFGATTFQPSEYAAPLRRWTRVVWRGLREWSGDAAYDRYLRSASKAVTQQPPLTPAQFYVEQLDRRYSHPNRCC